VGGNIRGWCGVTKDCMIRTHINYWLQDFTHSPTLYPRYKPNAINIKGQQKLRENPKVQTPKTPKTQQQWKVVKKVVIGVIRIIGDRGLRGWRVVLVRVLGLVL